MVNFTLVEADVGDWNWRNCIGDVDETDIGGNGESDTGDVGEIYVGWEWQI